MNPHTHTRSLTHTCTGSDPLPALFNFTEKEMAINPAIMERLIPPHLR